MSRRLLLSHVASHVGVDVPQHHYSAVPDVAECQLLQVVVESRNACRAAPNHLHTNNDTQYRSQGMTLRAHMHIHDCVQYSTIIFVCWGEGMCYYLTDLEFEKKLY